MKWHHAWPLAHFTWVWHASFGAMNFAPGWTPQKGDEPSPNAWVWRLAILLGVAGAVIGYVVGKWLAAFPGVPAP